MYAPASGARLPFKLLRWFSLASFALIAAIAAINAHLISSFVTTQLLEREGQVTRDFVQNILVTDHSIDYLVDIGNAELRQRFRDSVLHFTATHDILRTNVYLPDGTILWSSDRSIVGKKFPNNDELQQAIKGTLVVESGPITREIRNKPEHVGLPMDSEFFVETYIPVTRAEGGAPVGAV
jgi:two-component system sensor histidine kinase HydH